jgi:hypothetical protein
VIVGFLGIVPINLSVQHGFERLANLSNLHRAS